MAVAAQAAESAAATQTFGTLRIEKRVLTTPARTIAIENIASVSVGTHVVHRPRVLFAAFAIGCAILAFAATQTAAPLQQSGVGIVTIGFGIGTLIFAILALQPNDRTHYLFISSNDGVLTRFPSTDRDVLDEALRLLTEKINKGDEAATYNINFSTGMIENLGLAPAGSLSASSHVNGAGNSIASNGAPSISSAGNTLSASPASHGRAGAPDNGYSANRLANAPTGRGQTQNGGLNSQFETYVDYGAVLPTIVDMHRFYARHPGAEHLEQRLSELELLMRAGTQSPSQKTRLRELTLDLSQILQAYPPVVAVFKHVASLAGF